MKPNDLPQFAALMNTLGEVYGKEITEVFSEIYWNTLKRFEWGEVKNAASKHISDPDKGQFMPKPADIVRWIEGTHETRALKAWIKTTDAVRRIGMYENVVFDDPIIHFVIEALGGWIKLCLSKTEDLPFLAQDFQKYYLIFLQDPPNKLITHVVGIFRSSKPILIGHDKKSLEKIEKELIKTNNLSILDKKQNTLQENL